MTDFIQNCDILSSWDVGAAGGNREDLLDVITNISPEETQLLSGLAKTVARNTQHDWLLDSLEQPGDPDNGDADVSCTPESSDAVFVALPVRCRVSNLTHIIRKTFDVSETQQAIQAAGVGNEYDYQAMRALKELAMRFEFALLHSVRATQAAPQYDGICASPQTCRKMDGIFSILDWTTRDFDCLDSEKQGTVYAPAGSPCVFLRPEFLDDLNELIWQKGGMPKTVRVNSYQKRRISRFYFSGQEATFDATAKTLTNSIDVYDSDFGLRKVLLHRFMPTRRVLVTDDEQLYIAVLRPVKKYELAKIGNSDKGMVEGELTLEYRAPASGGYIDGLCNSNTECATGEGFEYLGAYEAPAAPPCT